MAVPAWVSELGITAQVFIAFAAIYGEKIRGRLSRPQLHIVLPNAEGDREPKQIGGSVVTVSYYRLHVRNTTHYSIANEVQVFITKVERREPAGNIRTEFSGAAPLAWQHQALYSNARNIGHSTVASADLLYLSPEAIHLASAEPAPESFAGGMRGEQHFGLQSWHAG